MTRVSLWSHDVLHTGRVGVASCGMVHRSISNSYRSCWLYRDHRSGCTLSPAPLNVADGYTCAPMSLFYTASPHANLHTAGIPYGKAPVDDLRWQPPVAHGPWDGKLDASKFGSICWQRQPNPYTPTDMTEDCLDINVFAPTATLEKPEADLPVMVWFHGGAYKVRWTTRCAPMSTCTL